MIAEGSEGGAVHHSVIAASRGSSANCRRATQIRAQDLMVADALDQRRIEREALHALREPRSSLRGVCARIRIRSSRQRGCRAAQPRSRHQKTGGAGEQKCGFPSPALPTPFSVPRLGFVIRAGDIAEAPRTPHV